jgi:hypothetical protein
MLPCRSVLPPLPSHIHLAAVVAAVREFEGDEGLVFLEVASRCL